MLALMRHRGPGNGIVRSLYDDRGAIGANEINLFPEGKTFCSHLEEYPYILFTGAIYNGKTNGAGDVQLVKEYYEKHGEDAFSRLDGMFTCAIVEKDEEVILVRDHVGAVPGF